MYCLFQFQKVRLKACSHKKEQSWLVQFQFQKVRLKDFSTPPVSITTEPISIPKGSIKSEKASSEPFVRAKLFQFQKVRLKAISMLLRLESVMIFQFQKVRLKD